MAAKTPNRELIKEILSCQRSNEAPNQISNTLAIMLMNMVENFANKGNWRGYSYRDEFIADAICHLISPGVTKDEDGEFKNPTPHALKFDTKYAENAAQLIVDGLLWDGWVSIESDLDFERHVKSNPSLNTIKDGKRKRERKWIERDDTYRYLRHPETGNVKAVAILYNPFAYVTQIIKHCFTRRLNLEKRQATIRDDVLIMCGAPPSSGRMQDNFDEQQDGHEAQPVKPESKGPPKKRGRKLGYKMAPKV